MDTDAPDALSERDYRRVREATRTYREDLVVRLAGEVGLRPAEMTDFALADVDERQVDGGRHHLLTVDGTQGDRRTYLPRDVHADVVKFANERDREASDPILSVSARRVQMLVADVGERLDDLTVSTRALRRSFARRLLLDREANPRVVAAAGGWSSLDTLAGLFPEPDDEAIVGAFADRQHGGPAAVSRTRETDRFERAVEAVQAVGRELGSATTRAEVEAAVCETAVDRGPYAAAWIVEGVSGSTDRTPDARAGISESAVEDVAASLDGYHGKGVEGVVVRRRSIADLDAIGRQTVALVPVVHGGTTFGTLALVSGDGLAFEEREREVVADLGRRVGQAIATVAHRRLLQADAVVELEFRTSGTGARLVQVARHCDCRIQLEGLVPAAEGGLVVYVQVTGSAPESVVDHANDADGIDRARLVRTGDGSTVVELSVSEASVAVTLTEYGGNVTEYGVADGVATITAEFPTDVDVRSVVDAVAATAPETEFVARREAPHPASTGGTVGGPSVAGLTDKQRSVLRAAYLAGYFDWPRGTTAEELADALGISSPTLHNHLRKAQRSVLDELFDDAEP